MFIVKGPERVGNYNLIIQNWKVGDITWHGQKSINLGIDVEVFTS